MIETQFIDGRTNDALRGAVRVLSRGFCKLGFKSVLETAVELSKIYAEDTIDINEVSARINTNYYKTSNDGVGCYKDEMDKDCGNKKKDWRTLNDNIQISKNGRNTIDNKYFNSD